MDKYISDNFTGSVDDLLNHCANLNTDMVEEQVRLEEKEECIRVIKQELECDDEEALKVYNEIALTEVKQTVDDMVKEGLLYISGYNEEGEPLFNLTELGKAIRNRINE
jgi:hypothetical protein